MTDEVAAVAIEAARDAGALLRQRLSEPRDVQFKGAVDLVTDADRAAEAAIVQRIAETFPDHRVFGEEGARGAASGDESESAAPRWVIDPLDGTTNYAHGLPTFAVSIGVEIDGAVEVGVVYDPMREELFVARRGQGATCNGVPIRVAPTDALIASILVTGFSYDLEERGAQAEVWRAFLTQVRAIRQTGSAALNLCYIAAGRLDGYWERPLRPWDVAAGSLLVTEAGGRLSNLAGEPFAVFDGEVVASNGRIHDALLATIRASAPARPI